LVVSSVVKVFEDTMKSVPPGRGRRLDEVGPVDVGTNRNVIARRVVPERS
jgi:hypothetical protein